LGRTALTNPQVDKNNDYYPNILAIEKLTLPGKALDKAGYPFTRIFGRNPYLMTT
jgi:hypothetical protein